MKPDTYTQLYIHFVFAVKHRQALLTDSIRSDIFSYMSGIITNLGHKSIIVNGYNDHAHLFLGLNPAISISNTVKEVKQNTSLHINQEKLCRGKFAWQTGYGAFSYSKSQVENVYKYIQNQEAHHRQKTFKDEYIEFLNKFDVEYNPKYLFEFLD